MVPRVGFPSGDELVALYQAGWGAKLPDVAGFNLGLHRRGKRHDPLWETARARFGAARVNVCPPYRCALTDRRKSISAAWNSSGRSR